MNLTSFNETVVAPFVENKFRGAMQIAEYPLFVMDVTGDLSAETMATLRESKLGELMPYDGVRLYNRTETDGQKNEWLMIVEKGKSEIHVYAVCYSVTDKKTGKYRRMVSNNGVSFAIHDELATKRGFFQDGKQIPEKEFPDQKALDNYANAASYCLFSFFANLINPHLFRASVRPDKQGKSVEWTRQRTHFVFIHKNHAANQKGFSGKADSDHAEHLKRMAHSRRAHDRTLRHPKWGAKVGFKIRVKACWVGPKEWEGNSGQIYRIVD